MLLNFHCFTAKSKVIFKVVYASFPRDISAYKQPVVFFANYLDWLDYCLFPSAAFNKHNTKKDQI